MQHNYHPLLQSQLGVFIECMQYPDCTQYNLPICTPLGMEVDMDRMERAFHVIYDSRVAWRIRFGIDEGGTPYQYEDDGKEFRVVRHEMSDADFYEYAHHDFIRPFDLMGDEPLVRVEIVSTEVQDYLLMDVHHLVMDGMSYSPIFVHQEFAEAYQHGVLPVETYTLLNAADDEQESLHGAAYEKAKAYYAEKYSDVDFATLSLRPVNPLGQMLREHECVDKATIDNWCKANGVAVNLLLQAAFSYVLSVLLREDRIAYTTVSHGRFDRRWRNIFGMFSREMPVMSEVKDGQTVLNYIRSFRSEQMSTIRNAVYPISHLCRDLKKMPGVCFNFQGMEGAEETLDTGTKSYLFYEQVRNIVTNDMTVLIFPMQDEYDIRVESSEAHNSRETMQMVARAISVTLQKMMQQPDAAVKSLSIVSEEEEQRLMELGTGERLDYDRSKTYVDLFREQAKETPDSIAVVYKEKVYTYRELDEITDRLAVKLHSMGVCPEVTVGVKIDRSELMVIYPLAIMKAGGAYMPLDPTFPADRLTYMCKDAGVGIILTDDDLANLPIVTKGDVDQLPKAKPDNMFVVLYTSGSTGRPKGVVLEHHNIVNFCHWIIKSYDITSADRVAAYANFGFDVHQADLWPALCCGAAVYVISSEMRMDLQALHEYVEGNRLTFANFSTRFGHAYISEFPKSDSLRLVSVAGEKLLPIRKPEYRLVNSYGPTEATVYASYYEIRSDYAGSEIGKPHGNCALYVVDNCLQLLPQGVAGELIISGEGVARGYGDSVYRGYRTGDLCRWNSEGQLEYIGRIGNQIKLRGFRIELGEIESAAMLIDGIKHAVAIVKNDQIVLYYTGGPKSPLGGDLERLLPEYMVPSVYMQLDAMPLTTNGKINKEALPEPGYMTENVVLPATKDEQDVLAVVEEMIGLSPISVTADLISLGLSSIAAMRLALRISQTSGKNISMAELMTSPTIRDIAANLRNVVDSNLGKVREKQEYYPLTDNQLGVYLDWEQHRDGLQYNVPAAIKLNDYDAKRLQTAVCDVIAAHPYLFAQLAVVDGEVRVRRADSEQLTVNNVQLTVNCEPLTIEPTAEFFQSRVRPFNLFEDRLFRFEIYTYGETTYLYKDIHHIITDGVSDAKLMSEIFAAYNGETIESETYTAYDRAIEEQEIKESPAYTEAEVYYKNLLSEVETTVYSHSTDNQGEGRAHYVQESLGKEVIELHCASLGVTPSNYLLTVFMEILHRITRDDRILVTTVNSGREHSAMQDIQGFFVKTLPVVYADNVADVQKQLIDSISHECYPYTDMVQTMDIHPEIMYVYEGGLIDDERIRKKKDLTIIPLSLDTVKVPLTLIVNPGSENYELSIEYDDALYNEHDMQTLLQSIIVLAENYAKGTSNSLSECSMLTMEEELRLIELGTGEELEYDKSKTFIDLFREQVAKTPDAIAVVDYCSQLTYRELDEASDDYAKTVTSGTFVCVEMPRVKEFIVAVLGIWKAGSAYVPIDAEYPEERKRFMREECGGKLLPQADIAYMIYTSGSTGKPKGVMVQHRALTNFLLFAAKEWELTERSRISCHTSLAFDASIQDLYPSLIVGGTVYLVPEEVRMDIGLMHDYIINNSITGGCYTCQFGQVLLQQYPDLPVEYIALGGEKLSGIKKSSQRLFNVYGPTECTVCSASYKIGEDMPSDVPIGRPVPNTKSILCDKDGKLLPQGVVGELCLAGQQIALGYYCNPELTAERFAEVVINGKNERIYKTGDLCRWNSDGQLEYIGRIDNQVKLRGFRIELGEIESAAMQIDGIKHAVAIVKNEQIVLYYVNETACAYEDETLRYENLLRSNLSLSLPEYMVPSVYVRLDTMPLTPNGKIDRRALPEPEYVHDEYAAPSNEPERVIAEAFQRVLNLDVPVSVTSGFSSLGGDSIKAMRLSSLLHQKGMDLSVSQILSLKTVRALSNEYTENDAASELEEELFFVNYEGYYPMSSTSRSMLLSDFGTQYSIVSHTHCDVVFDTIDAERLTAALEQVINANPFLKARIEMRDNEPMWHRDDDRELNIVVTYVDSIADVREDFVPYNLFGDDLSRFTIYVSKDEMLLSADFSHLIMDGISIGLFEAEVRRAFSSPDVVEEQKSVTGYDLCAIEQNWLEQGENKQNAEAHFDTLMRDAVSVPYPCSRTLDVSKQSYALFALLDESSEIEDFCKKEDITVNTYLQTALLCALMRILRQDKLVMFCTSSGRNTLTQDVLGNMAKSLPLVGDLQWMEFDAKALLKNAADQYSETLQHEMYPTNELTSRYNARQEFLFTSEILADVGVFNEDDFTGGAKEIAYKGEVITFFLYKSVQGNYVLALNYDGSLYSRRDMQSLLDAWYMLTRELCRQNCSVKQLPIVTREEEQRLLVLGDGDVRNSINADDFDLLPEEKTIVEHFMQVAQSEPGKEIVIDSNGSYTCEQLNLYSNKVAHWLISQGLSQGSAVGVETPRCKEYMPLAMGILKADCAIVTIEEDYPEERKQQIIDEADIKIVLTLETLQQIIAADIPAEDICLCTVESAFQIFFTSGTTGKPKGVVRTLSEITYDMNNAVLYGLHPADAAMINIVRFSFVACIGTLWLPVGYGNPSHILSQDVINDQSALSEYIRRNQITYSLMPSSYGVMLLNNHDLSLRDVFLSAEKIQPITNQNVRATNLYACTEILWVSSKVISPEDTNLTAGVAPRGTQIYILDEHQQLLPQGIAGEICVSSNTMARGYLNDRELNAKKFIANPFCPGKRLLRTGDLGYLDENGELNVVGRMDNMVKLRGFRIELDEITHTAMQCPGIDMCACIKHESNGDEFLCCYYTSALQINKHVLKSYLAKRLSSYMVPEVYMLLDKMPLNANGKIDRKKLPEPETQSEALVIPTTKDEQDVLEVVEEMLAVSPISVTANLISLGLSSIAGMRLSTRISQQLGKNISISQIMSAPTIRDIAANLKNRVDDNLGKVREKQEYYPLTDNQLGVYLDWEQHRDGLQYNVPVTIKFIGYDAGRLQAAVESVVAAHPYLFAQFVIVDGEVKVRRVNSEQLTVNSEQLTVEPTAEFFQSRVLPFNLLEDRLFRFEIYTYGDATYLFEDIHHIITDGVSDAQLLSEIYAAYSGETIEAETYTAYDRALEEQEIKASPAYTKAEVYYENLLSGIESTVYPHSTYDLGEGRARYVHGALCNKDIESHSAILGVTPSNYMLTVFMEVLRRITHEERVMITTVNSGREHSAMQDIQGFFVKTLPVVYADNVADVQKQLIDSISHECYPYTDMVQTMDIHPEIMYVYEGGLIDDERIRKKKDLTIIPLSLDTVKVPLTLIVNPGSENYELSIEYDDALYNEHDMQTLLQSIIVLAENYVKGTSNSLSECSMLTIDEELRLIELGTGEELEYDKSKTFIDLFKEQVAKTPDAIAVVDYCSQLTYRELDEASDDYAKTVTSGTFVCVEMPRVKEFIVAVLGIWKAGSAYVPIDAEYPEERKRFMREECGGKLLPQADIAYMIYTSGSTGKPKGAMVTHGGLTNFIHAILKMEQLTAADRIACHRSFSFDAHVEDIYAILTVGGSCHIMPEEIRKDLPQIRQFLFDHQITGGGYATAVATVLLQSYDDLPVRFITAGGEKLASVYSDHIEIFNVYGPTECSVESSYYGIAPGTSVADAPIGRPIENSCAYILDADNRLLPFGAEGELCVAGPHVGMGYWNNPELTAERFVEIIIGNKRQRIYKTGDLCRWNKDGQLEYIGRIDNQVKLRGFRIELGEIESAAMQIDGIKHAVAIVKNEQIVLYYTGESKSSLRGDIERLLPEYMVPSVYMQLDSMPLTPNGKIDKKSLPEPELVEEEYVAPRNEAEKVVAETFKDVLALDSDVSITSRFYALGGDSIKSIRLVSLLSQRGYRLAVADIMKLQTPEELAGVVVDGTDTEEENFTFMLPVTKRYPLTPMQEAMLLKHLSDPDSWGYRLVSRYKLNVVPTEVQLRSALDALATEHETLRTRIIYKDVEIAEQEITEREIPVSFEDIRETGRTIEDIHVEQLNKGFDLEEDSLMRVVCIVTADSECQLLIAIHHIITDGWSLPIYLSHFFLHLKDAIEGNVIEMCESDAGMFEQYVRSLQMRDKESSLQYWHDMLEGYETKAEIISYDNENDNENGVEVNDHLSITLSKDKTEKLKTVCAENNATLSHATELAWGIVLQRYTRQDDVVFAKVVSCRDKAPMDMSHVIGPFINSIPVRVKTDGTSTIAQELKKISQQAAESNAHDYCSMAEIQQQSELGSNLFQSILAFENYPVSDEIRQQFDETEGSLTIDPQENQEESFNDLALSAYEMDGQLCLKLTFDKEKYAERDMQNVLLSWQHVIEHTAATPEARIKEIGLLSSEEEHRLVELGTGERLDYDKSKTFIDLFKEQLSKTPDSIAVVDATSQLTYRELDAASDEYAETVAPGTFVCVEMPRVKEFVVAVLGIWKAGSAYVPINTEYPEERKCFMREECDGKQLPQADVAYMIYTSGSTGKPKGVMVQHSAITSFVTWRTRMLGLSADSRIAHYSDFAFDASLDDMLCPLASGSKIFIMSEQVRKDMHLLHDYLADNHITGCTLPTQLGMLLLREYSDLKLDYLMMGGEALNPCLAKGVRLINGYGPTEFTVCSSYYELQGDENVVVPVGSPVPNSKSFICDKDGALLPMGVVGELYLSGSQIALGYWNNPELTSERFVELTICGKKERVYKTGDLCRWNSEGQLEYMGRIDNQVKLRGFRIELGEVESAAMQIDGIKQAVAMVKNDQSVLYYTGEPKSSLKGDIERLLPSYMVPSVYIQLDAMPLTANGKIDRRALPEPVVATEVYEAPANPLEQQLHDIICEVLGVESISVVTDIHKLGMTSLKSMTVAMHVANQTGIRLSASDVMDCDSVRDIAVRVEEKQADFYEMMLAEKHPVSEAYKANQLHSLFLNSRYAEGFVTLSLFSFAGIDAEALASCMEGLVEAHPVMKSTLENRTGEWWFIPHLTSGFKVDVHELDFEPDNAYFEKLPLTFDVNAGGPLCRIRIYNSPKRVYLLMACHHTLTDSVSMMLLARDAVALMSGGEIEAVEHDYLDYLVNTDNIHNSQYSLQQLEMLDKELDGCVPVTFPASSCPDSQSDKAGYAELSLEGIDIDGYCQDNGSTPMSMFLMAAGKVFMEQNDTKTANLFLPVVNHGRSSASTFNGVGCYLTLSLVKYNGTESSADVAQQVRESAGYIHQSVDWMTRKGYRLEDSVHFNDHTAFQAAIGAQNDDSEDSAPFAFHDIDYPKAFSPLQLALSGSSERGYTITADYDAGLYAMSDILGLLKSIAEIIKSYH